MPDSRRKFVHAALGLHLISSHQAADLLRILKNSGDDADVVSLMVERGLIAANQVAAIFEILNQSITFGNSVSLSSIAVSQVSERPELEDSLFEDHPSSQFTRRSITNVAPEASLFTEPEEGMGENDGFSHYSVVGTIGVGGLGRVLHGVDNSMQREVAIKEIKDNEFVQRDKRLLARFLNEARITGQLQHPGIVPVYQIGAKADGGLFYVMKYVRGHTLEAAMKQANERGEKMDADKAFRERMRLLNVLIEVCNAMAYAHSKGVIHRDLKPGNVVLGKYGETILLDWGLAKYVNDPTELAEAQGDADTATRLVGLSSAVNAELTMAGEILGTPTHMAPEQVSVSHGEVDYRCDVYALGVMLFQLITGKLPYHFVGNLQELLANLTAVTPSPNPVALYGDCPPDLAVICQKAMAKSPTERYANANALAEELTAYRDGRVVGSYDYTRSELIKRYIRKHKARVVALVIATFAILTGGIFGTYFGVHAMKNERVARETLDLAPTMQNLSLQRVTALSHQLEMRFTALSQDLQTIASKIENDPAISIPAITQILNDLYAEHQDFEGMYYLEMPAGIIRAAAPDAVTTTVGIVVHDQEHVIKVSQTNKPYLSQMFDAVEGYRAIILDYPVMRGGQLIGIVSAMLKPDEFFDKVFLAEEWTENKRRYLAFIIEAETDRMIYDSLGRANVVGQNLITGEFARGMGKLQEFVQKTHESEFGIGRYAIPDDRSDPNSTRVYRLCAWQTINFHDTKWQIVAGVLFREGEGVVE